ncbi:MAG: 30S ribosomal protein S6 [Candidatus Pacebacteria bacterium]|nr:30S ribosomal protein S6 [Candidatus Paceibacterota bacterium]
MKNYELLYILPSNMTGAEIKSTFLEIEKEIEKLGAKKLVTLLDHPFLSKTEMSKEEGSEELKNIPVIKKKLAYPIEKNRFGFYCLFNFSAEEKSLKEIDYYLKMSKTIIRHFILQADPMNEEQLKLLHKLFARKKAEQEKEADKEKSDKEKRKARKAERAEEKSPVKIKEKKEEEKIKEDVKEDKKDEKVEEKKEEVKEKEVKTSKEEKEDTSEAPKKKEEKKVKEEKVEKEKKEDKKPASKKKAKVKLEDLEDKLDEILEDTII